MDDVQIMLYIGAFLILLFSLFLIFGMIMGLCPNGQERVCYCDWNAQTPGKVSCFCVDENNIIGGD